MMANKYAEYKQRGNELIAMMKDSTALYRV